MMTRREALAVLGSMAAGTLVVPTIQGDATPPLARGAPNSPERQALINAFRAASEKIPAKFEARTYRSDWTMPYRLFRPNAPGRLPLVVYLHGGGGLGNDNEKQMGVGNIFGTRVLRPQSSAAAARRSTMTRRQPARRSGTSTATPTTRFP
jgi:acetyl esterase/lipase